MFDSFHDRQFLINNDFVWLTLRYFNNKAVKYLNETQQTKLQKSNVEECTFDYITVHIECRFNKSLLLRCNFFSKNVHLFSFFFYSILTAAGGLHNYPALKDEFEKMLSEEVDSPYLLSYLVDYYESELEKSGMIEVSATRANEVRILMFFLSQTKIIRRQNDGITTSF